MTVLGEGLAEGDYVYLEVSDGGCGIEPDILDKIFDPFFTTKFVGRGLGLATVLGVARSHHGTIRVTSEPGQGTSIRLLLPALPHAAVPAPKPTPGVPEGWRGTGTILLVDDERLVLLGVRRLLEKAGFEVLTAENGRQALEVFSIHHGEIRAVLLDLKMPVMDGAQTLPGLRKIRPEVPVVLASAYSEPEAMALLEGERFDGFLMKPYRGTELAAMLRDVLGN